MERKLSFEEYFHMQMAKRKEKRPLVRNYTDALQTLPTDPANTHSSECSEASDTVSEWNNSLYPRTLLERMDPEVTRKRSSILHGPEAKRQLSAVRTNSPKKLHLDSSWETGKVMMEARTDDPAAKRQRLISRAQRDRCKDFTTKFEKNLQEQLSFIASLRESILHVKSGVKNRHSSGKEKNGEDVLSIFAGSGRSLLESSVKKRPPVKDNQGDAPLRWKKGRRLGAGAFGTVYECISVSTSPDFKARLAVKIVKIEPQYTKEVEVFRNEIDIVMELRHERIVSFYGFRERDDHLHLFMEYMAGGSLSDLIKRHTVLYEIDTRRFTKQILEAVSFLHGKNIIHRDIKGANVLLDGEGNVKLADFGLSKIIQKIGSKTDLLSYCGTPYWTAPEIMHGKGYGRKVDIWSVGCTVVEMLTGSPPLSKLEPMAAIFQIGNNSTKPILPKDVSQDAKEFVKAALTWDPSKRPSSLELLKHSFVLDQPDW